jgi:hypothetical protein
MDIFDFLPALTPLARAQKPFFQLPFQFFVNFFAPAKLFCESNCIEARHGMPGGLPYRFTSRF